MDLKRRDFHKLTLAALGGAVSGSLMGCGGDSGTPPQAGTPSEPAEGGVPVATATGEPHLCRGLNQCKNQGASGNNACAGQGTCASKAWHHDCGGANGCKGQGGCGDNPGLNSCKGEGGCHVPLMDSAWDKVRARFEDDLKKAGKEFGAAPAKT